MINHLAVLSVIPNYPDNRIVRNIMRVLLRFTKTTLLVSLFVWLTACGGSGSGSDDEAEANTNDEAEANTNCVLGSSAIGECQI